MATQVPITAVGATDPIALDYGMYTVVCSGLLGAESASLQVNYGNGWVVAWRDCFKEVQGLYPYPIYGPCQVRGFLEYGSNSTNATLAAFQIP